LYIYNLVVASTTSTHGLHIYTWPPHPHLAYTSSFGLHIHTWSIHPYLVYTLGRVNFRG